MWFLDTAAFVRLLRQEPGSDAFRLRVRTREPVCCDLLRTEARRAVRDDPAALADVERLLEAVPTTALTTHHVDAAGGLPGQVRSLGALHVVAALDLGDDLTGFVTYDDRQAVAARAAGMQVHAPT